MKSRKINLCGYIECVGYITKICHALFLVSKYQLIQSLEIGDKLDCRTNVLIKLN